MEDAETPTQRDHRSGVHAPNRAASGRTTNALTIAFVCLIACQAFVLNLLVFDRIGSTKDPAPPSHGSSFHGAATFSTRLAWDSRYMSLSHEHDELWNTSRSSATISTGDRNEVNDGDFATIAM